MLKLHKETVRKYYKKYTMPNMTSDTTPSGIASWVSGSEYNSRPAWKMFNSADSTAYLMPSSSSVTIRYTFNSPIPAGNGVVNGYYSSDDPKGATIDKRSLTYYKIVANYTDGTSKTIIEWNGSTYAVTHIVVNYNTEKPIESFDFTFSGSVWYTFGTLYDFNIVQNYEGTSSDYDYYEDVEVLQAPSEVERTYWKIYNAGQSLLTAADWNAKGSGNGYFGDDASVHDNYSGSYSDTFTFNSAQTGGEFDFSFYGNKQYNFRLSYTIYATINGTEQSIYSDSSTYQNGSDIHGWKKITLTIPDSFTALRIYTSFGRVNSTYCFGGLGKYQLEQEPDIRKSDSSDYDYYTDSVKVYALNR